MGYTHYWRQAADVPAHDWQDFTNLVRKALDNLPPFSTSAGGYYSRALLEITGDDDTDTAPSVNGTQVRFNGAGRSDTGEDLSHETFVLTRERGTLADWEVREGHTTKFDFCKTARKPYDLAVCAVLILADYRLGDFFAVSSDGDP